MIEQRTDLNNDSIDDEYDEKEMMLNTKKKWA